MNRCALHIRRVYTDPGHLNGVVGSILGDRSTTGYDGELIVK